MAIQPGRGNSKKFDFTYRLPEVLKIYRAGNKQEWDAYSDIPWDRLGRLRLSEEERYAGRWWWSHRAQLEYQGVSFGAAAIAEAVRQHYEFDLRLFLCQLTYEEGRHAEVSAYFADQLGGFIEELPHMGMLEGAAEAAETKLEAREWSLLDEWLKVGIAETISGEMFRQRYLGATDPCAKEVTRRILTDEMRHKSVIWAYLPHKIQQLSLEQKEKLRIDCIQQINQGMSVYCTAGLEGETKEFQVRMRSFASRAGLGCCTPEREIEVVRTTLQEILRPQLKALGIHLPRFPQVE